MKVLPVTNTSIIQRRLGGVGALALSAFGAYKGQGNIPSLILSSIGTLVGMTIIAYPEESKTMHGW